MINLDLDHFGARVLQDALTEATAQYWLRRAEQLEAAAPKPDDYRGQASDEQLANAWVQCTTAAIACRRRAELICGDLPEAISDEVWDVLGEAV